MNDWETLHKCQVYQRFHHGNVSICNHREDAEEPAEDPKPQFLNFLFKKIFKSRGSEMLYKQIQFFLGIIFSIKRFFKKTKILKKAKIKTRQSPRLASC